MRCRRRKPVGDRVPGRSGRRKTESLDASAFRPCRDLCEPGPLRSVPVIWRTHPGWPTAAGLSSENPQLAAQRLSWHSSCQPASWLPAFCQPAFCQPASWLPASWLPASWLLAFWLLAFWLLAFWPLAFWPLAFWPLAFWLPRGSPSSFPSLPGCSCHLRVWHRGWTWRREHPSWAGQLDRRPACQELSPGVRRLWGVWGVSHRHRPRARQYRRFLHLHNRPGEGPSRSSKPAG